MSKNKPEYIIVHHTAVSYDKNPDQFEATNNYHKSLGWGMIGYHYEIAKNGKLYKGRNENMVGAHTKEESMNYKSIGICLDGNFDVELPTEEQQDTLKDLIVDIMGRHTIPSQNIFPHRHFATYKSCYGSNLHDDWVRKLVEESNQEYMFQLKKVAGNPDVYAVHEGVKHKVSNEFTFNLGVKVGLWADEIKSEASLDSYKSGVEMMFTPID